MSHKVVKIEYEPNHHSGVVDSFNIMEKDGYKFLTWIGPWEITSKIGPNTFNPIHRRFAMFHKDDNA
jgi:hypothetical protein